MSPDCPHCGSQHTASRRQLFRQLMDEPTPAGEFAWYRHSDGGVMPPHSRFIVMLALVLGTALPVTVLLFLNMHLAVVWLAAVTLLLVVSLLCDLALTWRRYRVWGGEWLCSECREVFTRIPL